MCTTLHKPPTSRHLAQMALVRSPGGARAADHGVHHCSTNHCQMLSKLMQPHTHRVGRGVRIMVSTTRVMMEGLPRMAHVLTMAFWIMAIFSGTCGAK